MKKFFNLFFVIVLLITGINCSEKSESPTKGRLKVFADESVFNCVKKNADSFMQLYTDSYIEIIPVTSREAIVNILNNEAKLVICARDFNKEENDYISSNKLEIRKMKLCYDGIAVITSFENPLKEIDTKEIGFILNGIDKKYRPLIPGKNSGVYEFLSNEFSDGKEFTDVEIAESEKEIVERIRSSKNKIGFVGYNNLNDSSGVKVLNVGEMKLQDSTINYFEPHPGYFIKNIYPLSRMVYIFLNEIKQGIASGFATFLTGNEGQKIVLEEKLGPAAVPVKLIPYR